MNSREQIIRMWFEMWIKNDVKPINSIFSENVLYSESWGPEYHGVKAVKHWFQEWNTRGVVLAWDIKQFIHDSNHTVAEWHFKDQMKDGRIEDFNGITLVEWNQDNKIISLKEFGSKSAHYNPYQYDEDSPILKNADLWT